MLSGARTVMARGVAETTADTPRGTGDQPVVYKGTARPHEASLLARMP
jgi:hypothetical protein